MTDALGIADLEVGDELRITYETPRSDTDQRRTGTVATFETVDREYGPTGSTAIVLERRDEDDLILWPAWDEIRTDAAGCLGEIVDAERLNPDEDQRRLEADGGLEEVFRRETIVATDDGVAIGEGAVPDDSDGVTDDV